jgi:adenylate cyclase
MLAPCQAKVPFLSKKTTLLSRRGFSMVDQKSFFVTILFADIAGSTRLYEQLGDSKALALVNNCIEKINIVTETNKGRVIKTIGDEVMCRFDDPNQAVSAAIAMHEIISSNVELACHSIRLRIGMHHGPVIIETGDLYGDAVNTAARMVGQAKAGQIITNKNTLDQMQHEHHKTARLIDQTRVKGKEALMQIYEISWGQPEEQTMITTYMAGHLGSESDSETFMILQFKDKKITINQKKHASCHHWAGRQQYPGCR